jgi:LEA14-like dessication related protein
VELSSLKYELHGNGMFWADGIENDVVVVPANSSVETKFRFSMNFINMNRRLLDDVIAMRQVRYNFKGNAQVRASIPRAPVFTMNYDIFGLSEVKPKAE